MRLNNDLPTLVGLLACPACRSPLRSSSDGLRCTGCACTFQLSNGVPVFVEGHNGGAKPSLLSRFHYGVLGNPRVYDFQQKHFGAQPVVSKMKAELGQIDAATLVDIGAGTGVMAGLVSPKTRYVWLDNDPNKLRGLVSKQIECLAVLGDATRLPFQDGAGDYTLMIEVSHHISDDVLDNSLSETARVTNDRFIFVDAVRGSRLRSKLMWNLDLGRFPRPEAVILGALERHFVLERVERFRGVNHNHIFCVGAPRGGAQQKPAGS